MNKIYAVSTSFSGSTPKLSQEGYHSLKKAQEFIESRTDKPKQITPFHYRSDPQTTDLWCNMSREYFIHEILVKQE